MYFILTKDCSKAFYFLENREYTLGRKSCDIVIENDTSISRKHASISLEQGKIQITDLGSRYNTFVNNTKLNSNEPVILNVDDEIKLGMLETIYTLKEQKAVTSCSGLTPQEKKALSKIMKELNGSVLIMTWSKECSYLTVNEIMLTLKTLCALIDGQPIVTMDFWIEFLTNVKKNLPPPDHNNYKAVYADSVINRSIVSADQESRKSLFQSKVLVFKSKLSIAKIEAAVELAGGTCVHFNEKKITKETFASHNPEYLLIQDEEHVSNENDPFMNMIKYIQSIGKRSIPFPEIAMAIVTGSCEKNCNSHFDRTGTLIKCEEMVFTSDILATETQTQSENFDEKSSIIVPDTDLDVKPYESIDRILDITSESNVMQDGETEKKASTFAPLPVDDALSTSTGFKKTKECSGSSSGGKREGQHLGNDNKRIRLENTKVETYSSLFGSNSSNLFPGNNVVTSTQDTSTDDQDMKPLESIDDILNDTGELDLYKAKMISKNSNEHKNLKRVGEELHKDGKRIRAESSHKNGENAAMSSAVKASAVIDLTQDNDKIVTSTQVEENGVQRSFEAPSKKAKPENPFGFTRCGSKSKPKGSGGITDFFKPFSKTTQNEESIANISRINADTTLTSGKKKSPEKSCKRQNPFALNKPEKSTVGQLSFKSTPSTSSGRKYDTKKMNPFGEFSKKSEKNTKRNIHEESTRDEFVPYTFDISVVDSDMEKRYGWLSKNISIKDETDCRFTNAKPVDENMKKFLESFRNCVVVDILPEPVERISQNKSREETFSGKGNFKKFRKVQPLHMQTTIIPRSLYTTS